jgi:hypothetical protein
MQDRWLIDWVRYMWAVPRIFQKRPAGLSVKIPAGRTLDIDPITLTIRYGIPGDAEFYRYHVKLLPRRTKKKQKRAKKTLKHSTPPTEHDELPPVCQPPVVRTVSAAFHYVGRHPPLPFPDSDD